MKSNNQYDFLINLIKDENVYPVVRHESIEALANSGDPLYIPFLLQYKNDPHSIVKDSVELALHKLEQF